MMHKLSSLLRNGKIPARSMYKAIKIVESLPLPHLKNFSSVDKVYLIVNNLENFGYCKMCTSQLTRSQFLRKAPYCCMRCYKNDPDAALQISKVKSELYSNSEWKSTVEAKKIHTNQTRCGSNHPMQDKNSHEKQQRSLLQTTLHKGFFARGYEPQFIDWCEKVGIKLQTCHQSFKYFDPLTNKFRTYHPDFYIESLNLFIEVKSDYTVSSKCSTSREIPHKLSSVREQGHIILLVIMNREGHLRIPPEFNINELRLLG